MAASVVDATGRGGQADPNMLRRLLLGLVIGLVIGSLVAAALVAGLGMTEFANAAMAYALAAVTGALTGLVAGKPIWARGGQIEAALKAVFGGLLAAAGMFAVRRWLTMEVDLTMLHAGAGKIYELPGAALPLVAAVLGGFYELDNTDPPAAKDEKGGKRVSADKVRVAAGRDRDEDEEDDVPAAAAPKKSKR
jgi:hypothetical protein